MFAKCKELKLLDLSYFNTSSLTDMSFIFNGCEKLKEIKGLNNFNTKNVTKMIGMFDLCKELISLNLSNFDTSNVIDMSLLFSECYKLKEIKGLNNFNTNQEIGRAHV